MTDSPNLMLAKVSCYTVYLIANPLPCNEILRADWDELAEICSDISRVAGFQDTVKFQG